MQSAGLRTRARTSLAPSVDDTASVVTLHTIPDSTYTPAGRSRRETYADPSISEVPSSAASLIIQKPSLSDIPSSAPSLIIQRPESAHTSTKGSRSRSTRQKRPTKSSSSSAKIQKPSKIPKTSKVPRLPKAIPEPEHVSESEDDLDDLDEPDVVPPKFTIDLSKPPRERYNHVAQHFTPHRIILERLLRQIAKESLNWDAEKVRGWGRRIFRKLPSAEEDEELQGIAHVWGVEKFLLVAFNVLLDSFMGCTSGGARVRDPQRVGTASSAEPESNTDANAAWGPSEAGDTRGRMLHFRTLDWSMEPLRKLVCEYEYIERPGAPVVARQITYFGYVGVLTGVRKGLSISLNFRPCHDTSSWWKKLSFRAHQLFVLLGWRQGISSMLRECLLPSKYDPLRRLPTLVDIERDMPTKKTSAAYLIFSDGSRTTTMEKDHHSATVRSASDFIISLNHDVTDELQASARENPVEAIDADATRARLPHDLLSSTGMEELVLDSKERKSCVIDYWRRARERRGGLAVETTDVIEWMQDPSICNDQTHYAVVMDPQKGEISWLRRWLYPLEMNDPR